MLDITPAKIQYDGTTVPVPDEAVHTAVELNDRRVELQGSVTDSSQGLDAADAGQLSKAMFANGVAAQSMLDSGGVDTVVLTPITGANGLRLATPIIKTYDLLNGAIFSFKANNTNTGDMTVNVGQELGTLIGALSLFLEDGTTNIPAGAIIANKYYSVRYDDAVGAFILLEVSNTLGDLPTTLDSESNTLLKDHWYQAQTSGFANAYGLDVNANLTINVSITNSPGAAVANNEVQDPDGNPNVMVFVPLGKFFIVSTSDAPPVPVIHWTPLMFGGGAPVDFD